MIGRRDCQSRSFHSIQWSQVWADGLWRRSTGFEKHSLSFVAGGPVAGGHGPRCSSNSDRWNGAMYPHHTKCVASVHGPGAIEPNAVDLASQ